MKSITIALALLLTVAPAGIASAKPVALTPTEAVRRALRANLGLKYERLAPELSRANERKAASVTDPVIVGELGASGGADRLAAPRLQVPTLLNVGVEGAVGVRKTFYSGTSVEAKLGGAVAWDGDSGAGSTEVVGSASLTVRHPLLRGSDAAVNRAALTKAELARTAAEARLRRKAELVAADVLKSYWSLRAAEANLRIQQVALDQADKTLAETRKLIRVGKLAASEAITAEHQVQTQRRAVLLAEQALQNLRDKLARQIGLVGPRALGTPVIVTQDAPALGRLPASVEALQKTALERRGDYAALRIEARAKRVDVRAAEHELLPRLDVVGSVGVNAKRATLGGLASGTVATEPITTGRVSWAVGLVFEIPLGNREAKAGRDLAELRARRAEVAIAAQEQAISEELMVAWRAVRAAQALVALSAQAVRVARTKLANEQQLYRQGRTTARMLVLVHADLTREQLAQQQAAAALNQARIDAWAASGSLLLQLGERDS